MMLKVKNICGGYGGGTIIHDLSFNLNKGKVLGICGRNGVGKTTLIRLISGEITLTKGTIQLQSPSKELVNLAKLTIFERHALGLSVMPQEDMVFSSLTVQENLNLTNNIDTVRLAKLYTAFPILKKRYHTKAAVLSGGERKILSFVRTLSEKSQLICLDELSEGIAQENINIMSNIINEYQKLGISFLVCEQNINFQLKIADDFIIIDKGMSQFTVNKDKVTYEQLISHIHI